MTEVSIGGIIERDIDLLITEELSASTDFLAWFLSKVGIKGSPELGSIVHSSTTATGETDIELHIEVSGKPIFILLENKVDAPLQPRQAERYKDRCRRHVREGSCSACFSILVAPAKYLGDDPKALGFDFTIQYEDLVKWYESDLAGRDPRPFKLAILRRAIKRGADGWTLVPNEQATAFWRKYWELARSLAPELQMPKPQNKPETSSFIFFRPPELAKGVNLIHKVSNGYVDIQFNGKANEIEKIALRYRALLEPGMSIQKASKSAVVRIEVPTIDMAAPLIESESAVREAIWAAKLLLLWYKGLPKYD